MTTIMRHEFPTRNLAELLDLKAARFDRDVSSLEKQPLWFSNVLASAVGRMNLHCAVDPRAVKLETWEATVTAMQVGSALFTSARATTDTLECRIGHDMRTLRAGALPRAYAGNWVTAFFLACLCREKERLCELSQFPVSLLRESGGVYDAYMYDWVEALQAYRLDGSDFGDQLVAAVEGTDPDRLRHAPRDNVLKINYPPMNLLSQLARGDQDKFNIELAKALQWHKDHWSRDEDRSLDSEGFVAIGPLAVACLAHDAGFTITVESEYLPSGLLNGDWVNEFPT